MMYIILLNFLLWTLDATVVVLITTRAQSVTSDRRDRLELYRTLWVNVRIIHVWMYGCIVSIQCHPWLFPASSVSHDPQTQGHESCVLHFPLMEDPKGVH